MQRSPRPGSATVECALAMIFLGTLLTGMTEMGRAVMVRSVLTDAARRGATAGVAGNSTYTNIWNEVDASLASDGQLPATLSNGKATLTVSVATWNATTNTYGPDVVVTSQTFAPSRYDKVSVGVSVNASDVTWLFLHYLASSIESETVVMMKQ